MKIKRLFRPWKNQTLQRFSLVGLALILLANSVSNIIHALSPNTLQISPISETQSSRADTSYLAARNKVLYIADAMSGSIRAVDMTNPNTPTLLSVAKGANQPYIWYFDIVLRGNYAYALGYDRTYSNLMMSVIDITNPSNLVYKYTYTGGSFTGCYNGRFIEVDTTLLVNESCSNKLVAFSTADPVHPTEGASFDYSSYTPTGYGTTVDPTFEKNSVTLTFSGDTYLYAEVAVPSSSSMSLVSTTPISAAGFSTSASDELYVEKSGHYILVAHRNFGSYDFDMYTYDVTNPAAPTLLSTNLAAYNLASLSQHAFAGQYLVLMNDRLIDFSNPANPQFGNKFTNANFEYGTIENGTLYLSGYENDLQLGTVDVSTYRKDPPINTMQYNLQTYWDLGYSYALDNSTVLTLGAWLPIVKLMDVSDPNNLKELSTQYLTTSAKQAVQNYGSVYHSPALSTSKKSLLAASNNSLFYIDLTNKNTIYFADQITPDANDIAILSNRVVGSTWYVLTRTKSTNTATLRTYNVNEVTKKLTPLGSRDLSKVYYSWDNAPRYLEIVGNYALSISQEQTVEALNITNPASIGAPTNVQLPALDNYGIARPYAVGNTLLIPVENYLYAIDASNPAAMTIQSSINDPKFVKPHLSRDLDMDNFTPFNASTLLYTNPNDGGTNWWSKKPMYSEGAFFAKIDISNMANIHIASSVDDGNGLFHSDAVNGWGNIYPIPAVIGNYAFGTDGVAANTFYSFDISDLSNPKPLDIYSQQVPNPQPISLEFVGDHAYVGNIDYGEGATDLATFDISNPATPRHDGTSVHLLNDINAMVSNGNHLYTAQGGGVFVVYDTTKVTFPLPTFDYSYITTVRTPLRDTHDMKMSGNYLYAADKSNGLVIFGLSDPAKPSIVSSFKDASFSGLSSLVVQGNYVYGLAQNEKKLVVIDVSNPVSPTVVKTMAATQFDGLIKITQSGNKLYVIGEGTTSGANLTIFDITNVMSPVELGHFVGSKQSEYKDIVVYSDFAFIAAAGTDSIDALDISDPANIMSNQQIKSTTTSLAGVNVLKIHNNQLYTLAYNGEAMNVYDLHVLGATAPTAPTVVPVSSNTGKPVITGTYDPTATGLSVSVNNATYVLGISTELTANAGTWTLSLGSLATPIPAGTYNVIATATFPGSTLTDSTISELTVVTTATPLPPAPATPTPTPVPAAPIAQILAPTGSAIQNTLIWSGIPFAVGILLLFVVRRISRTR